ncbi:hypothetical protein GQ54DRAFT_309995 [Martensiomyces pterosporus]|nr:hypothetical protein GQ54DRAFT_309995 [Martensiomyces pterosporus]
MLAAPPPKIPQNATMGVYTRAFVVLMGGLLGGSAGFYYQAKEDTRLRDLRKMKMDEMRRLNAECSPTADQSKQDGQASTAPGANA